MPEKIARMATLNKNENAATAMEKPITAKPRKSENAATAEGKAIIAKTKKNRYFVVVVKKSIIVEASATNERIVRAMQKSRM